MEITEELIQTIENRVIEYCIAAYKDQPTEVIIEEGSIYVEFTEYFGGESNTERYEVTLEKLTISLDEVSRVRIEKEKESAELRRIEAEKQKVIREERETNNRRRKYLELQQEFG